MNQYETQALRERLVSGEGRAQETQGYLGADVCVVNTCTVTREADRDAFRLLRRISRRNPAARLVVTGCLASRAPEDILRVAPAALVSGNDGKESLPALLGCHVAPAMAAITDFQNRSRAFVKIQDGCNMHCSFCIIPAVRPQLICRPAALVEGEVAGLYESGMRELVLCGVRLGRYMSVDPDGRRVDFVALLERLLAASGDFRIRLSSIEVTDLTERLLGLLVRWKGKLAPSFHVPLQSGSDKILKRMQRWYSAGFYERRVRSLRAHWPGMGLFADVLVGFPGETESDFEQTLDFVKRQGFSGLHIFRFSRRPGTPAADFEDQVPESVLMSRSRRMRALDLQLRSDFAKESVGQTYRVLVERGRAVGALAEGGGLYGHSGGHAAEGVTDHFLRVRFREYPGEGLVWARVVCSEGPRAWAEKV